MAVEIDSRRIEGGAGEVILLSSHGVLAVAVHDHDGRPVALLQQLTPREALDAFRHTFADPRVPDIFVRTIES